MSQFPNPATQFKPGQSGNPGGINSETHRLIKDSAEKAARLQNLLLDGVLAKVEMLEPEAREAILRSDVNKIIGDALDRQLGRAVQQVDNTSSDGTMTPSVIRIVAAPMPASQEGQQEAD